jgi:DNA-binding SARP family transcriptional activator
MNKQIAVGHKPPDFQILGAFQMTVGGHPQEVGPEQQQRLLVALLSAGGAQVTRRRLMDIVWDDIPDSGAVSAVHHLATELRKRLAAVGLRDVLIAANGTYRLDVPTAHVDVHRFHDLTARARELVGDDDQQVVTLLEEALGLHRGEPLAGLRGRWIDGYRHLLVEERRAAELALYEAAIRVGESRERIPALNRLFLERPEDEWVAWLYMHALYRAGRQGDALAVWHAVTHHLNSSIAADSLKTLSDLHERILRQDDDLLRPEAVRFQTGEVRASGRPGPRAEQDSQPEDQEGVGETSPDDAHHDGCETPGAAGQDPGMRHAKSDQTTLVFNGRVDARDGAVFGTQINYGAPR